MQDLGNQITRDTLRAIRDTLPNTSDNQQVYDMITTLLTKKVIQPVPYTYNAIFWTTGAANNIAAGANATTNIQIQADADFLILNQTFNANTANAAVTFGTAVYPNATVLLTNTGSGFNLMDAPTPIPSIFGNGQFPYVLPNPMPLPAKSTLQVQVFNIDNAAGYNIRLSFNGVKLYSYN